MSEEQLKAFLEAIKADAGRQEKLKGVEDPDAVVAIAKQAGFDISKAGWHSFQANQTLELSEEDLEVVSGGVDPFQNQVVGNTGWLGCQRQ